MTQSGDDCSSDEFLPSDCETEDEEEDEEEDDKDEEEGAGLLLSSWAKARGESDRQTPWLDLTAFVCN